MTECGQSQIQTRIASNYFIFFVKKISAEMIVINHGLKFLFHRNPCKRVRIPPLIYIYVTLPPEMSHIATRSLFGYNTFFPKGVPYVSILAFRRNQFLQSFLHQKIPFLHTYKFISVMSKCLKQATLHSIRAI